MSIGIPPLSQSQYRSIAATSPNNPRKTAPSFADVLRSANVEKVQQSTKINAVGKTEQLFIEWPSCDFQDPSYDYGFDKYAPGAVEYDTGYGLDGCEISLPAFRRIQCEGYTIGGKSYAADEICARDGGIYTKDGKRVDVMMINNIDKQSLAIFGDGLGFDILSDDMKAYLRDKYDPSNMTVEQHHEMMTELYSLGVIGNNQMGTFQLNMHQSLTHGDNYTFEYLINKYTDPIDWYSYYGNLEDDLQYLGEGIADNTSPKDRMLSILEFFRR